MFKSILRHKVITGVVILLFIAGGYFGYQRLSQNENTVEYVTANIAKGALIASVSGSGQVSASEQVDVKPKVSGEIVYVGAKNGQEVKAGTILAQIDTSDAEKAVRDAQTSLETAKLELDDLLSPPDELTLLQAENSLTQAKESKQKSEDNLVKAYEDGFNAVVSAFFNLPTIMTDMENILYGATINKSQDNIAAYTDLVRNYDEKMTEQYKRDVIASYQAARLSHDKNFQNYKATSRYSDSAVIEALIDETYESSKKIAETLKNADNLISFVKDTQTQRGRSAPAVTASHQSSIKTYTSEINSIMSNLLSVKATIKSSREAIVSAKRSIQEKELSLAKLKAGPDELDVRAKKISVQQKEDTLLDAKQNLAECWVRAPFEAVVTKINAKKGESISSGSAVATLVTKQKIAKITLNEVDAAKVKVGQKATLTFDAIDNLGLTGQVVEIDTLGTVTQGVVTYEVKIAFDSQLARQSPSEGGDDRVKPGMSITASIIIEAKQDVLLMPNSAIKYQSDTQYVEIMTNDNVPRLQPVETGISNDTMTEVVSGLQEGDKVVTQTVSSSSKTSSSNSRGSGGGMEMMRIMR